MKITSLLAFVTPRPAAALHAVLVAAAVCAPAAASAKKVIYAYQGTDYTLFSGGTCLTASMAVSLKFTVPAALGANFNGTVTPVSWVATDGKTKVTSKTANTNASFSVGTDANGAINSWAFVAVTVNAKGGETQIFSANEFGLGAFDQASVPCRKASATGESVIPGTWSN